jgi:hypothetical protein
MCIYCGEKVGIVCDSCASTARERDALKAEIAQFKLLADGLLIALCETGIYELGEDDSPEGRHYNGVAKAAKRLDEAVQAGREEG